MSAGRKRNAPGRPLEARLVKQGRELASLRAQLERYQTALNGSNVTVFSQDEELRYTTLSNPLLGHAVKDVIGKRDDDIFPPGARETIVALKRNVLRTGESVSHEVAVPVDGVPQWFDLHIAPLRNETGAVAGLTCASIDITDRKKNEAHLRLLMREITHRSKNLLAVIQAMARQTANHAGSVDAFLDQFSARLQALASSHDLLVHESWHGAGLAELVRSQLGHYLESADAQVAVAGPPVLLKPEATQSLGLALHELATNAVKYGALSVPDGSVKVEWRRMAPAQGAGLELKWTERNGPPVAPPSKKGFGTLVIQHNLTRTLDAQVDLAYGRKGLTFSVRIPEDQVLSAR